MSPAAYVRSVNGRRATASAFGIEWLLSFALTFVIMAVATDDRVVAPITGRLAAARSSNHAVT